MLYIYMYVYIIICSTHQGKRAMDWGANERARERKREREIEGERERERRKERKRNGEREREGERESARARERARRREKEREREGAKERGREGEREKKNVGGAMEFLTEYVGVCVCMARVRDSGEGGRWMTVSDVGVGNCASVGVCVVESASEEEMLFIGIQMEDQVWSPAQSVL